MARRRRARGQHCGPARILAWVIGAMVALVIGGVASELGAMFPASGCMMRYSRATYCPLAGFLAAWANWIAIVAAIPVEGEASVQ